MAVDRLRLFFALWADDDARQHLARLVRPWRSTLSGQWIVPENLHLTLAFLGNVAPERLTELEAIGRSLVAPAFEFTLDRLELWPKSEVLCLRASQMPAPLRNMVEDLNDALTAAGFPTERRAFRPHVTLDRKATQLPDLHGDPVLVAWKTDQWCLAESRQSAAAGSSYHILKAWNLAQYPS